jgi:rhamnosyltransferase
MKIAVAIPAFFPEIASLRYLLNSILPWSDRVFIYNNGGLEEDAIYNSKFSCKVTILNKGKINLGLSRAFNECASKAWQMGCDALLLIDQDSRPSDMMIPFLSSNLTSLIKKGKHVAAVGPMIMDDLRCCSRPFLKLGMFGYKKVIFQKDEKIKSCDFLISAGTLIPKSSWQQVGEMDESLFVDHVDTEWCLRARHRGLQCFGIQDAILSQCFGSRIHKKTIFMNYVSYNPERFFHLVRNTASLCMRHYIPKEAKVHIFLRTIGMIILSIIRGPEHWRFFSESIKGLRSTFASDNRW